MPLAPFIVRPALEAAALIGVAWIHIRRGRYRRHGSALTAHERAAFAPYFEPEFLNSIRVCRVPQIEPGLPAWLIRALQLPGSVDITIAEGMAFIDAISLTHDAVGRENPLSLLFHELVHCVQYRELGNHRFVRRYLLGWAGAGFHYHSIPLEVQAYALQDRFEAGLAFPVSAEVRSGLARLKYL